MARHGRGAGLLPVGQGGPGAPPAGQEEARSHLRSGGGAGEAAGSTPQHRQQDGQPRAPSEPQEAAFGHFLLSRLGLAAAELLGWGQAGPGFE